MVHTTLSRAASRCRPILGLIALAVISAFSGWYLSGIRSNPANPATLTRPSLSQVPSGLTAAQVSASTCAKATASPLARIALLSPGVSLSAIRASGYDLQQAIQGWNTRLVVLPGTITGSEIQSLQQKGTLSSVGTLLSRSSTPNLSSCEYHLADSQAAQPYITTAATALIQANLLTPAEYASYGTIYLLSDDPFDANVRIVTFVVQSAVSPTQHLDPSDPQAALSLFHPVAAAINVKTMTVVGIGPAAWV